MLSRSSSLTVARISSSDSRARKTKSRLVARFAQHQRLPLKNPVRVEHDQALAVLAKNPSQHDFRHNAGIDQIAQHAARPHRRQLIDVADENQMAVRIDGAQKMVHQREIDHRSFIDDDEIRLQRIVFASVKAAFARIVFEQPVDRHRFFAGALGHAFGGAPGRRS